MSRLLLAVLLSCPLSAQGVFFECQNPPPQPGSVAIPVAPPDCEGITANLPGIATVQSYRLYQASGFPTEGTNYAQFGIWNTMVAPTPVPAGGPLPRPLAPTVREIRIPIPSNATSVLMDWEVQSNTPGGAYMPTGNANNGFDFTIVDAGGAPLYSLGYMDIWSTYGPTAANITPTLGLPGANLASAAFPSLPAGAFLSIAGWSGGSGIGVINTLTVLSLDNIRFTTSPQPFHLVPLPNTVPGSLRLEHRYGTPSAPYVTLFTANAGSFPAGPVAGIDPLPGEVASQLAIAAPPFRGTLDTTGTSVLVLPPGSVASNVPLYAVAATLDPTLAFPVNVSPPIRFITP